tara:strand:+ start:13013 stop:13315 length:303 start_codon:yes stop_codon:yes gene_type:complete
MAEQVLEARFSNAAITSEEFQEIVGLDPLGKYFLHVVREGDNTSMFVEGATVDIPTEGHFGPMFRQELMQKVADCIGRYNQGTLTIYDAPSVLKQLAGAL